MGGERSNLGFDDEFEGFDPKAWTPPATKATNDRIAETKTKARAAAEASGFKSREAGQVTHQLRRRRTGRNAQFNIKTTAKAIEEFCAIADQMGWGLGETLENALPLLRREYRAGKPPTQK